MERPGEGARGELSVYDAIKVNFEMWGGSPWRAPIPPLPGVPYVAGWGGSYNENCEWPKAYFRKQRTKGQGAPTSPAGVFFSSPHRSRLIATPPISMYERLSQ